MMYICMYMCYAGCSGPILGLLLAKAHDVAQPPSYVRIETVIHRSHNSFSPVVIVVVVVIVIIIIFNKDLI